MVAPTHQPSRGPFECAFGLSHGAHNSTVEFACHMTAKSGFTKQATCCTGDKSGLNLKLR
jgi:hypothetical protein